MVDKDEKPPSGYPEVPGTGDVEAPPPSNTAKKPAPDQYQDPGGGGGGAAGGSHPAGPGGYPAIPPAGGYGTPPPGTSPYDQQQQQQAGQPYPQQQPPGFPPAPGQPVMGIPVLGDRVAFIHHHPVWGPNDHTRDNRFAVCAWLCFILGFFMPIFWLISVLLPCCLPGRHVRLAATASCLASIAYAILAIILAPSLIRARNA